MAKEVAVVIPLYKETPDEFEKISLIQCLRLLKHHQIIFFTYDSLDLKQYDELIKGASDKTNIEYLYFEKRWFKSIHTYNRLLLSEMFYKRFLVYNYILIYQLDAFVFKDELHYWCDKGLDYVGAINNDNGVFNDEVPRLRSTRIVKLLNKSKLCNYTYRHVGNGGLSLRHVKNTIRLLKVFNKKAKTWRGNEDKFFTYYGNLAFPIYKLASHDQAIHFAFEHQPDECLHYLNNELPFGCHGWYPYHIEFWKPYFEKYGFNIGTKKSSI